MTSSLFTRGLGYEDPYREDDQGYGRQRNFSRQYDRNNYGQAVDEVAAGIAQAVFRSRERSKQRHYSFESEGGILGRLKGFSQKPIVKEAVIIALLMALKGSLWFVYRKASEEGLEVVDL